MIYLGYLITVIIVVFLSVKASDYVDLLDKKTNLSGAFLGGIMLSAVTSLPELFTSISSTVLIGKPGLCLGNILGSDLFNLAALATVILFFFRQFNRGRLSPSYRIVAIAVFIIYVIIELNFLGVLRVEILTVSITSLFIILMYITGVKYLSAASDAISDEEELEIQASKTSRLTVRQIGVRFFFTAIGIVVFSIIVTYLTDEISVRLNIGAGFAGALFLGVATSLPEVTSTISLFKMKNYNIAIGNIIGSNLFNFIILAIVDVISISNDVYLNPDQQVIHLMICGMISTPLFYLMIRIKNRALRGVCALGMVASYGVFLVW
ncbi:MAG: cation transporter [Eubacteriaceae bacterium]|nr:cation transporter [Eubacteriaceae bacterium]